MGASDGRMGAAPDILAEVVSNDMIGDTGGGSNPSPSPGPSSALRG